MLKLNKSALGLLLTIATATEANGNGFVVASAPATKTLIDNQLIEVNSEITNAEGEIAARITDAGRAELQNGEGEREVVQGSATASRKPIIEIEDNVEMETVRTRTRSSQYPFDALEVGQSFFVGDDDVKSGDAFKTLASTVAGANSRYAVPTGEKRPNRRDKSKMVDVVKHERKFELRRATHPQRGNGARVWRVEVEA